MRFRLWAAALLAAGPGYVASTTCFWLDGTESENYGNNQPCNSVLGTVSMCCATNRTIALGEGGPGEVSRDLCLPNGLCLNEQRDTNGTMVTSYWRNFCSSKDWPTASCLKICSKNRGGITDTDDPNGSYRVTPCANSWNTTKYCCGNNNTACCDEWDSHPDAVTVPLVLGAQTNPSATTGSGSGSDGTSAATVTVTAVSDKLPKSAKIGLAVGVPLSASLFFALGAIMSMIFLKRKQDTALSHHPSIQPYHYSSPERMPPQELAPNGPLIELATKPAELDHGSYQRL